MHLYKTQNILFDVVLDQIHARSLDQVFKTLEKHLKTESLYIAVKQEWAKHGFSIVNGVLICNAPIKGLSKRTTLFMRFDSALNINGQAVDLMACTVSPARLGVLNLRYLARLTRFFGNKDLIEDINSVRSIDGLKIALNGEDALVRDRVA